MQQTMHQSLIERLETFSILVRIDPHAARDNTFTDGDQGRAFSILVRIDPHAANLGLRQR